MKKASFDLSFVEDGNPKMNKFDFEGENPLKFTLNRKCLPDVSLQRISTKEIGEGLDYSDEFEILSQVQMKISGHWKNGMLTGKGKIEVPMRTEIAQTDKETDRAGQEIEKLHLLYSGDFVNNFKDGYGKYVFQNGIVFNG
jgi:hypothetical protein